MEQKLLWMPAGVQRKGYMVAKCAPVKLEDDRTPKHLWLLYEYHKLENKPILPYKPEHFKNAFFEDFIHDWNMRNGMLEYYGSGTTGCWLLLEYEDDNVHSK